MILQNLKYYKKSRLCILDKIVVLDEIDKSDFYDKKNLITLFIYMVIEVVLQT